MGLFDRFRRPASPDTKASAAASALVVTPGQPVWSPRNYEAFSREAYGKNVVAYQAINRIGDALSSVKLGIYRGDTELTDHPLAALLKRPNPLQSYGDYMRAKIGFLLLAGNGYEERVTVAGQTRELYQLRPDRMKIIPSNAGVPAAYEYAINQTKVRFDVDPRTLASDLRHLKLFNPLNDWYGMSPVESGAYAIDQNTESMKWMQALLQNSARPSGALTVKDGGTLSPEAFNRLKAEVEDQYQGSSNAGRPMLLEGGLDWVQMGLSPTDMGILETKYSSARDIALAFGVPPLMLGIKGDATYSNYSEARLAFWEDTVLPLLDMILTDWNAWLAAPFKVEIRPNLDDIPAIAEKRQKLWEMANASTDLTINERRQLKGYGPIDGGDILFVSSSEIPLADAAAPSPDPVQGLDSATLKTLAYGATPH